MRSAEEYLDPDLLSGVKWDLGLRTCSLFGLNCDCVDSRGELRPLLHQS